MANIRTRFLFSMTASFIFTSMLVNCFDTGVPTNPYQYPSFVRVVLLGGNQNSVGGVAIDKDHVLTTAIVAAHYGCFDYNVVAGLWNASDTKQEQWRNVVNVTIHPKAAVDTHLLLWSKNDIAVLKLDRPLELNDQVGITPLPTALTDTGDFSLVGVTGDGLIRHVNLPAISEKACKIEAANYYNPAPIERFMLCLRKGNMTDKANTCHGFGSPLFKIGKRGVQTLVGIGSFQIRTQKLLSCSGRNMVTVYHELFYYVDWIRSVIENGG